MLTICTPLDGEVTVARLDDLAADPLLPSGTPGELSVRPLQIPCRFKRQDVGDHDTRPVGQKLPNAWGLFDMLGNMREWTNGAGNVPLPPGPVHNIEAELQEAALRTARGGYYYSHSGAATANVRNGTTGARAGLGLRLVRTLPE